MMFFKNKIILIALTCLISAGMITIGIIHYLGIVKIDAAALVNGEPVELEEFTRIIKLRRAAVIDSYLIHGAEYGDNFWDTIFDGETPIETLKRTALNEAVRIKIQLMLAKEKCIIKDASYLAIRNEMDAENSRRQENAAKNLPVYGPLLMDEDTFIEYYVRNVCIELKNHLSKDELRAEEDELLSYYESVKELFFAYEDTILFDRITISYGGGKIVTNELKETAGEAAKAFKIKVEKGGDIFASVDEIMSEYDGIKIDYSKERLDNESAPYYAKYYTEIYDEVRKLETDIVSRICDAGMHDELILVIVRDRKDGGYIPFKECRSNVEFLYIDKKYDEYISMLIDTADIEIIKSVYDKITSGDAFGEY